MKLHRWQNQLIAFFFSRFPTLTARWVKKQQLDEYGPPPWTSLTKPVTQCRVALVTTAGVHRKEDTPFNMEDKQGDPTYRIIPRDIPHGDLCITHDYYDHRSALSLAAPRTVDNKKITKRANQPHRVFRDWIIPSPGPVSTLALAHPREQ